MLVFHAQLRVWMNKTIALIWNDSRFGSLGCVNTISRDGIHLTLAPTQQIRARSAVGMTYVWTYEYYTVQIIIHQSHTSSGNVALNMRVCLMAAAAGAFEDDFVGMVGCLDIFCTSGMNPRSSIRSASSKTRNLRYWKIRFGFEWNTNDKTAPEAFRRQF